MLKALQGHCTTKNKDQNQKSRGRTKKYTANRVTTVRHRRAL